MSAGQHISLSDAREDRGALVFWRHLSKSLRNPEFWALSSWLDILVKARKSRLGILWLMTPALVYVFGLGAFFAGMGGKPIPLFAAHVALGSIVFRTLMSTVMSSAGIFHSGASFIMDGRTRLTDYLLQSIAKSFFDLCMYLPITCIALWIFPAVALKGLAFAPVALLLIYINALWISVVFGLLGARFPDFGQLLSNISIFLFLLTPIIWYPDTMPAESLRGQLMRANPFYHFIQIFRAPILVEPIEPLTWWYVGISSVMGLAIATLLYRRYARFVPLWI
ncbi:ABC-2 type transport system permease protein [Pseudoxanthomonas sp. GM95]|uniref:ABC transporter permease n=1 Tax=Pseudoxanthomonas sp. GM95 TaxID=1881043 RepID=UPI0008C0402C|nr:ABC transporter permease [Pseudoxanthomonas sp. GM95]SEK42690.1 ABC-2 type transport system permease protein [Pseudoxanthomonas sp. GM95]